MKKEYMRPMAEKIVFDYAENVTANSPGTWGGCGNGGNGGTRGGSNLTPYSYDTTYATKDINQINYECHEHYADAQSVCGQDGHNVSNPFYRCKEI